MRIGYFLSCEEYGPHELVEQARLAEEAGFEALWISDHFHPWNDNQGQSPLVWSVIGALSQVTRLPVTTAVTCPTVRQHPALVAQAAATAAVMLPGGFTLGVGTGEALNEHVTGARWPTEDVRLEMLEEAVEVMRALWSGDYVYHHGRHYTVEDAKLYTRPETPPKVYVSAFGPRSFDVALRLGDGFMTTMPVQDLVERWRSLSRSKGPTQGGYKVCWAGSEDEGVKIAHSLWANSGLPGELSQVLYSPKHFEQASSLVTEDMTRASTVCGPDVDRHVQQFRSFASAGFDEVYVANMGPNYAEMIQAYGTEVLPQVRGL